MEHSQLQKGKRQDLTQHLPKLEAFWQNGMKGYGTPELQVLVKDCVFECGLEIAAVKHWIDNKKRKHVPGKCNTEKVYVRRPSAKDLFYSDTLKDVSPAAAATQWNLLKGTEREREYEEKAKKVQKAVPGNLSPEGKKVFYQKKITKIKGLLAEIEDAGYEAILVLFDKNVGTVRTLGTEIGDKFIDANKKVCLDFAHFVGGGMAEKQDLKKLKKRVRSLYKKLYQDLMKEEHMSYKAFENGLVFSRGLPSGIKVQGVESYSIPTCQLVLQSNVTFHKSEVNVISDATVSHLVETRPTTSTTVASGSVLAEVGASISQTTSTNIATVTAAAVGFDGPIPVTARGGSNLPTDVSAEISQTVLTTISSVTVDVSSGPNLVPATAGTVPGQVDAGMSRIGVTPTQQTKSTAAHSRTSDAIDQSFVDSQSISPQSAAVIMRISTESSDAGKSKISSMRGLRNPKRPRQELLSKVDTDTAPTTSATKTSSRNVYIVEKIVDEQVQGRQTQYLVKWKGYSELNNTWEPKSSFIDQTSIDVWKKSKKNVANKNV